MPITDAIAYAICCSETDCAGNTELIAACAVVAAASSAASGDPVVQIIKK